MHYVIAICAIVTFIIPLVQLSIGFNNVVKDGQDATDKCRSARDLPLLLAIGGIFALFFLGTAYGFLKMLSSIDKMQSDVAGKAPKILIGLVSFIFGAITFIFFILIQMRVYAAYSNGVEFTDQSSPNYCSSTVMRGALAMIILTYMNIVIVIGIIAFIVRKAINKRRERKQADIEMQTIGSPNDRF